MNSKNKISLQPLELILCSLLVSIVIITFVQVLFRYVFQFSLAWTEELARYIFLWLAALSIAYAFKTKAHLDDIESIYLIKNDELLEMRRVSEDNSFEYFQKIIFLEDEDEEFDYCFLCNDWINNSRNCCCLRIK